MNYRDVKVIDVSDWDSLVSEVYGRPYSFQQQEGCRERGLCYFTVPGDAEDYDREEIPEVVNGEEMGVRLSAWLARDPKKKLATDNANWAIDMWWHRNFYPHLQAVANDLHSRGLLPAGEYGINVDW